jgi:hypothetical protein
LIPWLLFAFFPTEAAFIFRLKSGLDIRLLNTNPQQVAARRNLIFGLLLFNWFLV